MTFKFCPVRKTYVSGPTLPTGGCFLRPWMLGYRKDFGFASCCDPEQLVDLAQLFLSEGFPTQLAVQSAFCFKLVCALDAVCPLLQFQRFRTDPDLGGTEKLAIALPQQIQLDKPYVALQPLHGSPLSVEYG